MNFVIYIKITNNFYSSSRLFYSFRFQSSRKNGPNLTNNPKKSVLFGKMESRKENKEKNDQTPTTILLTSGERKSHTKSLQMYMSQVSIH